ncbi:P-loop containing nucleoside triphosphate hydrolase protein [Bisporella sp. PMI_857]|nr:P-loop containing nucleoside triphosphate hydrolase protein [Bisporella sp. PMI_857]
MDFNSLHGPGESNFSSSSPLSAAQALENLKKSPTRCVSTGLRDLDALLQNRDPRTILDGESFYGGVSRGKVTEIYGPSGVGKTALGMQIAASALHAGGEVMWTDAAHPLPGPRFSQILASHKLTTEPEPPSSPANAPHLPDILSNLTHISIPTLAHLIAFLQTTPTHPPPKTSLLIIDSFSTLINNAFPRHSDSNSTPRKPGQPNPSARKFPILQFIVNTLHSLAATHNLAVVVISQCVTKMRPGRGATLVPTINTPAWEQGLGTRVVLFRDWGWNDDNGDPVTDVRLAEVLKAEGIAPSSPRIAGFSITSNGITHLSLPTLPKPQANNTSPLKQVITVFSSPSLPRPPKRKLRETDLDEIPDSEAEGDEDYGWDDGDEEEMPAMPPQWQGSEDILVPVPGELEADDMDEREGEEEDKNLKGEQGEKNDEVIVDRKEDKKHLPAEIVDSEDEADELAL